MEAAAYETAGLAGAVQKAEGLGEEGRTLLRYSAAQETKVESEMESGGG